MRRPRVQRTAARPEPPPPLAEQRRVPPYAMSRLLAACRDRADADVAAVGLRTPPELPETVAPPGVFQPWWER